MTLKASNYRQKLRKERLKRVRDMAAGTVVAGRPAQESSAGDSGKSRSKASGGKN